MYERLHQSMHLDICRILSHCIGFGVDPKYRTPNCTSDQTAHIRHFPQHADTENTVHSFSFIDLVFVLAFVFVTIEAISFPLLYRSFHLAVSRCVRLSVPFFSLLQFVARFGVLFLCFYKPVFYV